MKNGFRVDLRDLFVVIENGNINFKIEDNDAVAHAFVSQLDAIIFSILLERLSCNQNHYIVIKLDNVDLISLHQIDTGESLSKDVKNIKIVPGFLGISRSNPRWVQSNLSRIPEMRYVNEKVSNLTGYVDIPNYFDCITPSEKKQLILRLLDTNADSVRSLKLHAERIVNDMSSNTLALSNLDHPDIYLRFSLLENSLSFSCW